MVIDLKKKLFYGLEFWGYFDWEVVKVIDFYFEK